MTNMIRNYKSLMIGSEYEVPISGGKLARYVNLDNAASTPTFISTMETVNRFMAVYSNVHRGSGFKSIVSTDAYEKSRSIIAEFVGAKQETNSIIFVKNSTEAINRLAILFDFDQDDVVIVSSMEHHSNDLPWRKHAKVKYIGVDDDGILDMDHFQELLEEYKDQIKLVAITGASNVTGHINDVHFISQEAHKIGAKILVDASQLLPHKKFDMKQDNDEEHIDFVVFTAHKLYAPFGTGVLIGPKAFFDKREPDFVGGGTVHMVTENEAIWNDVPERFEAGTPNIVGAIALASSIRQLQKLGMEQINKTEHYLFNYLMNGISSLSNIKIYGGSSIDIKNRVGVVSFNLQHIHHSIVSAALSYEYGIGVRSGCFCAHPYVLKLLDIEPSKLPSYKRLAIEGDKQALPGLIRVSLGLYNEVGEIDRLLCALERISKGNIQEKYVFDQKTHSVCPQGWSFDCKEYFDL